MTDLTEVVFSLGQDQTAKTIFSEEMAVARSFKGKMSPLWAILDPLSKFVP